MRRVVHRRRVAVDVPDSARLPAGIDDLEGDSALFQRGGRQQSARAGTDNANGFAAWAHCDILVDGRTGLLLESAAIAKRVLPLSREDWP